MRDFSIDFTASTISHPALLVRLTRLDGTVVRITSAETSIETDGTPSETFSPLPGCQLYAVKHIIDGEMPSTQIDFAHSEGGSPIATEDINRGLWDGATVQIYPVDRNAPVLADPLFTGTVQPITINPVGGGASFDCRGVSAQAESVIQTFSQMCRTDVFSTLCGLTAASFAKTCTVASVIDKFNITVSGITGSPADGWFNQGVGQNTTTGKKFDIASWLLASNKITTYLPICHLFTVGDSLTLYPGCDKTKATCVSKFSNIINFQGEPHFRGAAAMLEA